jgi:hypothetical protein
MSEGDIKHVYVFYIYIYITNIYHAWHYKHCKVVLRCSWSAQPAWT